MALSPQEVAIKQKKFQANFHFAGFVNLKDSAKSPVHGLQQTAQQDRH